MTGWMKNWKLLAGGLALALLAIMLVLAKTDARRGWASAAAWERRARDEKAAFQQTVANFRAARAEAERLDALNKARVEADQRAITERTVDDYEARLAAVRDRYAALVRPVPPRPDQGGRGSAPLPGAGPTPRRADGPAPQAGLPPEDALIATEQAIQLEALQAWVRGQAGVGK